MSSNDNDTTSISNGHEKEEESIDSHEKDRRSLNKSIDNFFLNTLEQARDKLAAQEKRLGVKYETLKNDLDQSEQAREKLSEQEKKLGAKYETLKNYIKQSEQARDKLSEHTNRSKHGSVKNDYEQSEHSVYDFDANRDNLFKIINDESFVTGDFFHRMKAYESLEAQQNGELKGLQKIMKILNEQIKLQEKRNQRLKKKLDAQLAKLPDGALMPDDVEEEDTTAFEIRIAMHQRRMEGNQSIKLLYADLCHLEKESKKLQNDCESLRDQIRDKSARLQTIPSDSVNKLGDHKREIEAEIELKQKQLRQLLIEEKSINAKKNNTNEKERILAEKMEQSDPWEEERKGLVGAIAHAQQEFQDLCNQLHLDPDNIPEQRSVVGDNRRTPSQLSINDSVSVRSKAAASLSESRKNARKKERDDESDARSRVSQRSCASTEKVRYTHELLRNALKRELDSISSDDHPINTSIKIEERYQEELDAQLVNIEKSIEQINNFERETFENTADNNQDNIMWQQRIDVLQNEYLELRAELRNSKM